MYAFLSDRARVMHELGHRLREGGAIVVITPLAAKTPADRRDIALDEDEISLLTAGWEQVQRFDADGLVMVILRGPGQNHAEVAEKERPTAYAVTGACAVVTDASGRVLLGRSTSTMWELPGGRADSPEPLEVTAVRELTEETGLIADPADAHVLPMLWDDNHGVPRMESTFTTVRLRTKGTLGADSRTAALAMVFKLVESAQQRWRAVNAPHLVALVRAGARFERGQLLERPETVAA
jgi:protein-L-isoaspartate(D-aspartate) O-methyltransferase